MFLFVGTSRTTAGFDTTTGQAYGNINWLIFIDKFKGIGVLWWVLGDFPIGMPALLNNPLLLLFQSRLTITLTYFLIIHYLLINVFFTISYGVSSVTSNTPFIKHLRSSRFS